MKVFSFHLILPFLALSVLGCEEKKAPVSKGEEVKAPPLPASPPEPEAPKEARSKTPLNVLLLTIDALRADMPWTGYDKPIAPHLSKLAEESVIYENHRSVSSYTAQTVATLMTGRYASTLYRTGNFFTNYFGSNEWITEAMQEKSIRTLAVHAHLYFDRAPGLKQGFDVYKTVPGLTWNSETDESVTSPKSVEEIIKLLSDPENTKGQFFLWSHLMDPHDKYVKHKESPDFGNDNRGRYDSEVWFTDMWLGKLFEFGEKQPWWQHTAIVISADHGEAFGEHGMYKHAFELWECLTRVPLIIKAPGALPKRITAPRSHIDIAPTVMELMQLDASLGFQGKSLVPEIYGEEGAESREPILLELAEDTNNPARRALIEGDFKLIVFDGASHQLFNIKQDPGEEKDLAKEQDDKAKELRSKLDAAFAALPVIQPFGGNKLRSGKIATGPKGPPEPKEPPEPQEKDKK